MLAGEFNYQFPGEMTVGAQIVVDVKSLLFGLRNIFLLIYRLKLFVSMGYSTQTTTYS